MSSKGDKQRPGTGYSDGWDRVFGEAPVIKPLKPHSITTTSSAFIHVSGYELVKSSAIHCADDMAAKAEGLILAMKEFDMCIDEFDDNRDKFERALESRTESIRGLISAIYEYRKRMSK